MYQQQDFDDLPKISEVLQKLPCLTTFNSDLGTQAVNNFKENTNTLCHVC